MAKAQIVFRLSRELSDKELDAISHLHSVFGILSARLTSATELLVEYDAARLSREETRGTIEQHGIPIV